MKRIKRGLDSTLQAMCVALFATLVLSVTWQVFTRQVLSNPSGWSEELAKYVFIWLGLFGSALVFGEQGHIAVDFLVRKLPARLARANAILGQLVVIAFAASVLVYGGWRVSALAWNQSLSGLPANVGWLYTALPISGALIILYSLFHLVTLLRPAPAAPELGDADTL